MKITAYGGILEIGGNKILLEDRDTKVFLDFGVSFSAEAEYFGGEISPRKVNGIGDYLEFDLLPKLEGLYAEELIKQTEIPYRPPEHQGVLLSHAHYDHVGYTQFLDASIPIHCGETSKAILSALSESSPTDFNLSSIRGFRTGKKIQIDDIEVEPIHVDHSIPGAYGFIIHTSGGTLAYSGDLRLHGPAKSMTEEFVQEAAQEHIDALLIEGTRVGQKDPGRLHSEMDVNENVKKVVSRTPNLVVASFYGRDIDRINTFHSVALATDRKFIIPMKMALLLTKLRGDIHLTIPDILSEENLLVYKKRKKAGEYDEKEYFKWERQYLDRAVGHKYVHDNQSKVILAIEPREFTELIDIKPDPGGQYIYSMSEPHNETERVDQETQRRWLEHFEMGYHAIHASGHASPEDIVRMVEKIDPKAVIPIHTEHPDKFSEMLKKKPARTIVLEKSRALEL